MQRLGSIVAFSALIVLGGACRGEPQDPMPEWMRGLATGVAAESLAGAWETAPEEQKAVLRDGELTAAEYERAVLATLQCLRDEGIVIRTEPAIDETGWRIRYEISGGPDIASVERTSAIYDACLDEHQTYIEHVWSVMNGPTEAEWQAAVELLFECLAEASESGAVPPAFNSPDFFPWLEANGLWEEFQVCRAKVNSETGVALGSE